MGASSASALPCREEPPGEQGRPLRAGHRPDHAHGLDSTSIHRRNDDSVTVKAHQRLGNAVLGCIRRDPVVLTEAHRNLSAFVGEASRPLRVPSDELPPSASRDGSTASSVRRRRPATAEALHAPVAVAPAAPGHPRASSPRAGPCRIVNSGACRVPSGRRRTSPAQTRSNRCDQGCRSDWWPYVGRCRGNRWGTDSCQRRQRRRNVHVVPDTSEESASLALSAVQYRFLGPPLHPHPIPPARSAHAFGGGHLHGSSSRPAHWAGRLCRRRAPPCPG